MAFAHHSIQGSLYSLPNRNKSKWEKRGNHAPFFFLYPNPLNLCFATIPSYRKFRLMDNLYSYQSNSIIPDMNQDVYLAPMSGITDLPFRLMSREFGVKHCFFEMLDAKALIYEHPRNKRIIKTLTEDLPISAQLVGADISVMLEAAEKLTSLLRLSFLDINVGCPAKKVIKKGAGSALLKDSAKLAKMLKKLTSKLKIPVTIKLRTSFYKRSIKECVERAKMCEASGASMIFLHGRTVLEGYSGDIDYESIKAVKKAVRVPLFGSGNIFNPLMAKKMFDETGCDGVLAARGALGNPWIFKDIEGYLKNGELSEKPTLSTKKKILKKHLTYIEKYREMAPSNKTGFMGKVAMWYLKGIPEASCIREKICRVKSYRNLINLINNVK